MKDKITMRLFYLISVPSLILDLQFLHDIKLAVLCHLSNHMWHSQYPIESIPKMKVKSSLRIWPFFCQNHLVLLLPQVRILVEHPSNNSQNNLKTTTPRPVLRIFQPVIVTPISFKTFYHRKTILIKSQHVSCEAIQEVLKTWFCTSTERIISCI